MLVAKDSDVEYFLDDADHDAQGQIHQEHLPGGGGLYARAQEVPHTQEGQTPQQKFHGPGSEGNPKRNLPGAEGHLHRLLEPEQNPKRQPARKEDHWAHEKRTGRVGLLLSWVVQFDRQPPLSEYAAQHTPPGWGNTSGSFRWRRQTGRDWDGFAATQLPPV